MSTPLPNFPTPPPTTRPPAANTGLWFDKFCNTWNISADGDWKLDSASAATPTAARTTTDTNPKLAWLQTVVTTPSPPTPTRALLTEHVSRRALLAQALDATSTSGVFSVIYRFASGLGREHPIENGFIWHHTLGTPFLPATSVKGLVRAYAETWCPPEQKPDPATLARIFGPHTADAASGVGSVIFLDAIPTAPVPLKADVMTPHYGPYYQDTTGRTVPGDWHSPTPIPFLTVADGAKFIFTLLPRPGASHAKSDCATAFRLLTDALAELGAGAKTATGYGRFKRDAAATASAATPAQDPLFAEIATATPQTAAQIVEKILATPDPATKKQLAQKMSEKTTAKDFKPARQKAAEKPDHWLNKLKHATA
jgi:CRISPR-associated protein Cmr6